MLKLVREVFEDKSRILQLDSRKKIYNIIKKSPGIHFRELKRRSKQAVGALQYHIDILDKHHLIKIKKEGKFARFFPVESNLSEEEKTTLSFLRHETTRKIILLLLTKKNVTNKRISAFLELSPSTISFHLQKLEEDNMIQKTRKGKMPYFSLVDQQKAKELLISYKKSFLDELVDSYVELWQEAV